MSPQQYLEDELKKCAWHDLSSQEKKSVKDIGLKNFLFGQITRKRFRRWKLPDLARERIDRALDFCISMQKPLLFRFRFGGYKLWRLESAPEVDWAEFFALAHYSEYLAPIIAAHAPGVKLLFMSDDVFVERLDNVPPSDTEAYYESFKKLCAAFKRYAPENFSMEMKRHSALFNSKEELDGEFDVKMKELEASWRKKQDPEKLKNALTTSALNIKWDGVRDLTKLSDKEKQSMIERSAIMHDALVQLPTIRSFSDQNPGMISIFTTPFPSVVAIGTTKTSVAKFWVGSGILEDRAGRYFDHIISPSQIEKLRDSTLKEIPIDLIPLKNFSTIKVYGEKIDFANNK